MPSVLLLSCRVNVVIAMIMVSPLIDCYFESVPRIVVRMVARREVTEIIVLFCFLLLFYLFIWLSWQVDVI